MESVEEPHPRPPPSTRAYGVGVIEGQRVSVGQGVQVGRGGRGELVKDGVMLGGSGVGVMDGVTVIDGVGVMDGVTVIDGVRVPGGGVGVSVLGARVGVIVMVEVGGFPVTLK